MGVMDIINKDDRIELRVNEVMNMMRESAKIEAERDIMLTGYKKHIDHETVLKLLDQEELIEIEESEE